MVLGPNDRFRSARFWGSRFRYGANSNPRASIRTRPPVLPDPRVQAGGRGDGIEDGAEIPWVCSRVA